MTTKEAANIYKIAENAYKDAKESSSVLEDTVWAKVSEAGRMLEMGYELEHNRSNSPTFHTPEYHWYHECDQHNGHSIAADIYRGVIDKCMDVKNSEAVTAELSATLTAQINRADRYINAANDGTNMFALYERAAREYKIAALMAATYMVSSKDYKIAADAYKAAAEAAAELAMLDTYESYRTPYLLLIVPSKDCKDQWVPGLHRVGDTTKHLTVKSTKDVTILPGETAAISLGFRVVCLGQDDWGWGRWNSKNVPNADERYYSPYQVTLLAQHNKQCVAVSEDKHKIVHPTNPYYSRCNRLSLKNVSSTLFKVVAGQDLFQIGPTIYKAADYYVFDPEDPRVKIFVGSP